MSPLQHTRTHAWNAADAAIVLQYPMDMAASTLRGLFPNKPRRACCPTPSARQRKLPLAAHLLPIARASALRRVWSLQFIKPRPLALAALVPVALAHASFEMLLSERFFLWHVQNDLFPSRYVFHVHEHRHAHGLCCHVPLRWRVYLRRDGNGVHNAVLDGKQHCVAKIHILHAA